MQREIIQASDNILNISTTYSTTSVVWSHKNIDCNKHYILWTKDTILHTNIDATRYFEGILPKGPYLQCVSMAGRALLAGYHQFQGSMQFRQTALTLSPLATTLTIQLQYKKDDHSFILVSTVHFTHNTMPRCASWLFCNNCVVSEPWRQFFLLWKIRKVLPYELVAEDVIDIFVAIKRCWFPYQFTFITLWRHWQTLYCIKH